MTAKATASLPRRPIPRCDRYPRRIGHSGYLKIDRSAKSFRTVGDWEIIDTNSEWVWWQILHADYDPDPRPTDYRLKADHFSTTSDLLEATAYLLRNQPELIVGSNWHGLIRLVLADTREYVDRLETCSLHAQNATAPGLYRRINAPAPAATDSAAAKPRFQETQRRCFREAAPGEIKPV